MFQILADHIQGQSYTTDFGNGMSQRDPDSIFFCLWTENALYVPPVSVNLTLNLSWITVKLAETNIKIKYTCSEGC